MPVSGRRRSARGLERCRFLGVAAFLPVGDAGFAASIRFLPVGDARSGASARCRASKRAQGERLYEYQPPVGLDSIDDCYALNVGWDSSVWLYYYSEFPLVCLRNRTVAAHWSMPLRGSHAFAVSPGFALFAGGYDDRDTYHLFDLSHPRAAREIGRFALVDEEGEPLVADRVFGRGDGLYILSRQRVYRCGIADALRA